MLVGIGVHAELELRVALRGTSRHTRADEIGARKTQSKATASVDTFDETTSRAGGYEITVRSTSAAMLPVVLDVQ